VPLSIMVMHCAQKKAMKAMDVSMVSLHYQVQYPAISGIDNALSSNGMSLNYSSCSFGSARSVHRRCMQSMQCGFMVL